jgi:hypothetical protein
MEVFLGIGNPIDRLGHGMWFSQGVPSKGCWKQIRAAQSRAGRGVFVRVREGVFRSSKTVELQCEWRKSRFAKGSRRSGISRPFSPGSVVGALKMIGEGAGEEMEGAGQQDSFKGKERSSKYMYSYDPSPAG